MCGIFGIINYDGKIKKYIADLDHIKEMTSNLFSASQLRGKEASGICMTTLNGQALVYKTHKSGKALTSDPEYNRIMDAVSYETNFKIMIGHTRVETKGTKYDNANNHPIVAGKVIGINDGGISNTEALFNMNKSLTRKGQGDSEIIFRLIDDSMSKNHTMVTAATEVAQAILGPYACAFFHLDHPNYLTLFTGALSEIAVQDFRRSHMMIFASTDSIIDEASKDIYIFKKPTSKLTVAAGTGIRINTMNGKIYTFETGLSSMTGSSTKPPLNMLG